MTLEVYLVRHGKTVFNTVGRLQGWSDSPLTPQGRQAAEALGRGLALHGVRFDAAFSSTSPRAADTARLVLQHGGQGDLALGQLADWREYGFGGFEGELVSVLHDKLASVLGFADRESWLTAYRSADRHLLADAVAALDGLGLAENEAAFVARLRRGMAEVVNRSGGRGRVLVVAHGMAITAVLKQIDFSVIDYRSVPNVSVSRLVFADGVWSVVSVGEMQWAQAGGAGAEGE
ncbi:histidine phosphatase family protein [Neisseria leonii]|uniref:histidine phosphatase family protein n=1 Tax=Neisseria leonii TaxID=2995413 RepID=UPI00237BC69C|nr:histidine phosphatase family protein [Neisseria sp. 3986]MDD9325811.1 histidine phosphatase family protein [Neisseria sp. 3986]